MPFVSWRIFADVLRCLDSLDEIEIVTLDSKHLAVRSAVEGWCGRACQAAGVALPQILRQKVTSMVQKKRS